MDRQTCSQGHHRNVSGRIQRHLLVSLVATTRLLAAVAANAIEKWSQQAVDHWKRRVCPHIASKRLKISVVEYGKPCNAGHLREAEGCRPYRLRYKKSLVTAVSPLFYGMKRAFRFHRTGVRPGHRSAKRRSFSKHPVVKLRPASASSRSLCNDATSTFVTLFCPAA
ncbi:MAG: hypothetical protein FWC50_11080 [Planctomycetaceae bacterium]|nr:hypothetical protein [Planctomycetaceae bacterium]